MKRPHTRNALCVFLAVALPLPGWAEDKNGVAPTAISRPSGPGSLEGLGESFQPALNTGTASYSVPLKLPSGVAGFSPSLALRYDGGNGFGVAGIGWSIGPGNVRRQVDEGLPRYGVDFGDGITEDRFLGFEGEELVPLANGFFLAKIQGSFNRYEHVRTANDDFWIARTKSGLEAVFGRSPSARVSSADGSRIFYWCLERQTDTNGNSIDYSYTSGDAADRQTYLSEIRYGPGAEPRDAYYRVNLIYEPRPDPFTDYRSGFAVRTALRLRQIDVRFVNTLIRRYVLGYEAHPHWSLLSSVAQFGNDETCPPVLNPPPTAPCALPVTRFTYATLDLGKKARIVSAADAVIGSVGEPFSLMDGEEAEFIDLNSDGLPDILNTELDHVAYLNRGQRTDPQGRPFIQWQGPIAVAAEESRVLDFHLHESSVHLSDMTGDGLSDLVVSDVFGMEFFANSGANGWERGVTQFLGGNTPPAPFGPGGERVGIVDLDFDKRIDVIETTNTGYFVWLNLGDARFSPRINTDGCTFQGNIVQLGDAGVDQADMNGDRLLDIVSVLDSKVVYCPSVGFGRFDSAIEVSLPPDEPSLDAEQTRTAKLVDVSGEGLADLVIPRFSGIEARIWINLGNGQFAPSKRIVDLPDTPNSVIRFADINGNGTTDLVFADSTLQESRILAVDLGELLAETAFINTLRSVDNGYGRISAIRYRSSSDYAVEAGLAANPWTTSVPFPVAVVSRVETTFGLDLDGFSGPDPLATSAVPIGEDVYITDFVYRDGFYDLLEKQFRGFAFAKQIQHGDERFGGDEAPTLVTRFFFHTGAPDGLDNDGDGEIDEFGFFEGREEEPLKGVELARETTTLPDDPLADGSFAPDSQVFARVLATWEVRNVSTAAGGSLVDRLSAVDQAIGAGYRGNDPLERSVRQAVQTQVDTLIIERGNGEAKHLRTTTDIDALGNTVFEFNQGDVDNSSDDLFTAYEYCLTALAEQKWLMNRVSRSFQKDGGPNGTFVSESRNYYDGDPIIGLPLGEVGARGNLHRAESLISKDPVPAITERSFVRGDPRAPGGKIDTLRRELDAFGNTLRTLDANGNERRMDYDSLLHIFPERETIVVDNNDPSRDLVVHATYDLSLGVPLAVSDFNGHISRFEYDAFGRLIGEYVPGDHANEPTKRYTYELGAPVSNIRSTTHTKEGGNPDVTARQFFDGLGRRLGMFEFGGPVMQGVTLFNTRGLPRKSVLPYVAGDGTYAPPNPNLAAIVTAYDASGRVIRTITPPDKHGVVAVARIEYAPLRTREFDGEDNRPGSPHFNTPKTLVYDGLNRLIEVHEIETLSAADSGTFITRYRYAMPDLLTEIEDASNNTKYMRYDGLGRRIFMNDLNRGHLTYTFDAMGNQTRVVDAKKQVIEYTYDGANRLSTEDLLDSGTPLSLERSPDVAYHYDFPSPEHPQFHNTRGKLSFVNDLTGGEFIGYDMRGNLETVVKRIDQIDGTTRDFTTVSLVDSAGRVYEAVYPDGGVCRYEFDARGLLRRIPNFVDDVQYTSAGQKRRCDHANTVTTNYEYDLRLRLTRLQTLSSTEILQDLNYDFDQSDNIIRILDERDLVKSDPRSQTASYLLDNCYRLQRASGEGYGIINYDYDRLGNMVSQTSPDIADPEVNIGQMISGGSLGTAGRIGRSPGQSPGPHALTQTVKGATVRRFEYDDNGNMTDNNGDGYVYDFNDRLGKVFKNGRDIRYLYDYTGRRIIKRVDGNQTTYITKFAEIRDGKMLNYVFAGGQRVARVDGRLPDPPLITQRIALLPGWNLVSFQVQPVTTDPAVMLADVADNLEVVFAYNGTGYDRFVPNTSDSTITKLRPLEGYWLYMTATAELLLTGISGPDELDLPLAQARLVGLPGFAATDLLELLRLHPNIERVQTFEPATQTWSVISMDDPALLQSDSPRLLNPTSGAWVIVKETRVQPEQVHSLAPTSFYHGDHLNSTTETSDAAGQGLSSTAYYPFGNPRFEHRAVNNFDATYRFVGKENDQESDLLYSGARFDSTALGRFVSVDPLAQDIPADWRTAPQYLNGYSYALNNPIAYVDPTGAGPVAADAIDRFSSATPLAADGEMFKAVKELEQGFKGNVGDALPDTHRLTELQARGLAENVRSIITKTIGRSAGKNINESLETQLKNARFRYIDQVRGAREALNKALDGTGITVEKYAVEKNWQRIAPKTIGTAGSSTAAAAGPTLGKLLGGAGRFLGGKAMSVAGSLYSDAAGGPESWTEEHEKYMRDYMADKKAGTGRFAPPPPPDPKRRPAGGW